MCQEQMRQPLRQGGIHTAPPEVIQDLKALDWVIAAKSVLPLMHGGTIAAPWLQLSPSLGSALQSERSGAVSQELGTDLCHRLKF